MVGGSDWARERAREKEERYLPVARAGGGRSDGCWSGGRKDPTRLRGTRRRLPAVVAMATYPRARSPIHLIINTR